MVNLMSKRRGELVSEQGSRRSFRCHHTLFSIFLRLLLAGSKVNLRPVANISRAT